MSAWDVIEVSFKAVRSRTPDVVTAHPDYFHRMTTYSAGRALRRQLLHGALILGEAVLCEFRIRPSGAVVRLVGPPALYTVAKFNWFQRTLLIYWLGQPPPAPEHVAVFSRVLPE